MATLDRKHLGLAGCGSDDGFETKDVLFHCWLCEAGSGSIVPLRFTGFWMTVVFTFALVSR